MKGEGLTNTLDLVALSLVLESQPLVQIKELATPEPLLTEARVEEPSEEQP